MSLTYRKVQLYKALKKQEKTQGGLSYAESDILYHLEHDPAIRREVERQADTDSLMDGLERPSKTSDSYETTGFEGQTSDDYEV